jgi:hypothetical protein
MADASASVPSENDLNIDINVDISAIIEALLNNSDFLNQLRTALLKDARRMGNTMGTWAQAQPATPSQQRRLS